MEDQPAAYKENREDRQRNHKNRHVLKQVLCDKRTQIAENNPNRVESVEIDQERYRRNSVQDWGAVQ